MQLPSHDPIAVSHVSSPFNMPFSKSALRSLAGAAVGLCLLANAAQAQQTITGYNITNVRASGSHIGFNHTYDGTITPAGNGLFNYTGGGGTLNNSAFPVGGDGNMVIHGGSGGDNTVMTFFLDNSYTLSKITFWGGLFANNSLPGALIGATVTFGGASAIFTTVPSGSNLCSPNLCNDDFVFAGTALEGLVGSTITIRNFRGNTFALAEPDIQRFSVGEVFALGTVWTPPIPEPGTWALMLAGGTMLGATIRRRKQAGQMN